MYTGPVAVLFMHPHIDEDESLVPTATALKHTGIELL